MIKLLFLASVILMSTCLHAQDNEIVIRGSKKITMEMTPRQVIDSLKKRFPNARAIKYYQTSPAAAKSGWSVTEEDNTDPEYRIEHYTLSFKRDDFNYYGLFRADGTLVRSKYQENSTQLPAAVKSSLKALAGGDYKDYTILSKTFYRTRDENGKKEYYEVTAVKKGNTGEVKRITLDPSGKILKTI